MDDRQAAELRAALDDAGLASRPVAVLDLDAVDHNLADLTRRAAGKPIRVASKSLRVRRLLDHSLAADGFAGILAFTLPEALWLAGHGHTDLVVAYPTADRPALARLAADDRARAAITLMVDSTQHLDLIDWCLCEYLIDLIEPFLRFQFWTADQHRSVGYVILDMIHDESCAIRSYDDGTFQKRHGRRDQCQFYRPLERGYSHEIRYNIFLDEGYSITWACW